MVSMDTSQTLAPSIVVAVPDCSRRRRCSLPAAFAALDDNGARPIGVEHLGLGQLDVALVVDTAGGRVPGGGGQAASGRRRAAPSPGRERDSSASTRAPPGRSSRRPPIDRPTSRTSPGCARRVIATSPPGCSARSPTSTVIPGRRRAIIVMSAGGGDWTTPAETTALAEDIAARDVQVFWLAHGGRGAADRRRPRRVGPARHPGRQARQRRRRRPITWRPPCRLSTG